QVSTIAQYETPATVWRRSALRAPPVSLALEQPRDSDRKIPSGLYAPPEFPLPAHESIFSGGSARSHCFPAFAGWNPLPFARSISLTESRKQARRKNL